LQKGAKIIAYDSVAENNVRKLLGDKIHFAKTMYEAVENADALFIATEWPEFKNPNFELMAKKMKNKAVFDGRNMYPLEIPEQNGFYYKSIGRRTIEQNLT
jgi:UDPglucose 6-dehydrogenase